MPDGQLVRTLSALAKVSTLSSHDFFFSPTNRTMCSMSFKVSARTGSRGLPFFAAIAEITGIAGF